MNLQIEYRARNRKTIFWLLPAMFKCFQTKLEYEFTILKAKVFLRSRADNLKLTLERLKRKHKETDLISE